MARGHAARTVAARSLYRGETMDKLIFEQMRACIYRAWRDGEFGLRLVPKADARMAELVALGIDPFQAADQVLKEARGRGIR